MAFFSHFASRGPLFATALVGAGAGGLMMSYKKMNQEGGGREGGWFWGKGVKVLPHGELVQVSGNVWQVTGEMHPWIPLSRFFLNWDRNMTVFRPSLPTSLSTPSPPFQMNDDALIIHNGIAMNEEEMKELETLGTPTVLIVPKISHMRDVMFYKERYPNIVVICPSEIIDFVNNEIPVDHSAEDIFPSLGVKWYAPPLMTRYSEFILEIPLEGELPSTSSSSLSSSSSSSSSSLSEESPPPTSSALLFCDFMISKTRASPLVMWFASLYGVDMRLSEPQRSKLFDNFSYGTTQTMQEWTESTSSNWEDVKLLLFTHGHPLRFQHNPFIQKEKETKEIGQTLALERGGEMEEGERV